jgi:hypothetical protein
MTALRPSAFDDFTPLTDTACPPPLSRPDLSARPRVGGTVTRLRTIDSHEFRVWFAPWFAGLLQARFRTPEQVAAMFGVRHSTAWAWWRGDNRASGDVVARVFLYFPDAVADCMAAWEARR